MSNKQWLTVAECAKVLGVSKARIRQLLAAGRVRDSIKPGRDWVIRAPLVILPGKRRGPARKSPTATPHNPPRPDAGTAQEIGSRASPRR